jgi:proteasome lid subunit RPN8/RPN11
MKIVKTKTIEAKDVSEISDGKMIDFKDRAKLHDDSIPDFFVYIQDYAWNAFVSHGNNVYKALSHEAQGIFVGHYFKDRYGEFIVATAYEEGDGNSQSAYVEMSEECLAKISEKCQADETLMLIWVHTHPGFGVFYSSTDYSCLQTNFYKPYQIGIVVDILQHKTKGFKVKSTEVLEFSDYALFNDEKNLLFSPYESHKIEIVKKTDEKINELTAEVERLKTDLQTQTDENTELKKVVQQKEKELESALQSNTDIKDNLQNKEQDNELLTKDLQAKTNEIEQLKTELQNKTDKVEELNREIQSKSDEIEKLKQTPQSSKQTCCLWKIFKKNKNVQN